MAIFYAPVISTVGSQNLTVERHILPSHSFRGKEFFEPASRGVSHQNDLWQGVLELESINDGALVF